MAKDFRASQVETARLIATGSIPGSTAGLIIYSGSIASDREGTTASPTLDTMLTDVGSDVFMFVSGTINSGNPNEFNRTDVSLFGGDVVISGTLYAERQVIEVDSVADGDFYVTGNVYFEPDANSTTSVAFRNAAGSTIFNEEQLNTCPNCNKHYPFTPRERFDHFFGKNNYEIVKTPELAENPLNFPGYKEKLERGRKITGHHCAVMVAQGVKDGIKVTSFAIDSRFNGGSINASAGEAIVYCFQKAIDDLTPVVAWSEGGGQAMQESNIALHYMVKTVLAANTFKDSTKLPFINIYTNKCYGGITASFAAPSIADICFAEPSMVGFAGQHIVKNQTREDLPEGFQSSRVLVEKGMCDGVFNRKEINEKIIGILKILLKKNSEVNSESLNETSGTNIQTREAS